MRLVVTSGRGSRGLILEASDAASVHAELWAERLRCHAHFRAGAEFDIAPFFQALAEPGWEGERWLESRLGGLHLDSTYAGCGLVPLRARLRGDEETTSWSAELILPIGQDQLQGLARQAAGFSSVREAYATQRVGKRSSYAGS